VSKFLFIIQGEGRGHLTQAISLAQLLRDNGHEVVAKDGNYLLSFTILFPLTFILLTAHT
jgi:hypothetical protein